MHSRTRDISLIGSHGFSNLLPVRLVKRVAESVATRLAKAYGGRASRSRIEREEAAADRTCGAPQFGLPDPRI